MLTGSTSRTVCNMAAFCDYDRDGWLDVFLQTNLLDRAKNPDGQANYLFHNNGNGTFTNVTEEAGITGMAQGHSAVWWDYDNDGWPDIYVANDFDPPTAFTITTETARSPMSSTWSCPTCRARPWARTWGT